MRPLGKAKTCNESIGADDVDWSTSMDAGSIYLEVSHKEGCNAVHMLDPHLKA